MIVCIQDNQMIIKQRKKKTMNDEQRLIEDEQRRIQWVKNNTEDYVVFEQNVIDTISRLNNVVISKQQILQAINDYIIDQHRNYGIDKLEPSNHFSHRDEILRYYLEMKWVDIEPALPKPDLYQPQLLVFGGEDCDEDCIECQG